ncbi:hypothetical protein [Acidiplasma cupricumulans]|uniref:hypothetical protein n=1 Tax=Acidiplasma cupricumulans TaxID=312540 RepID=UPI000780CBD3|nr:hypothetical protein [Acidiplasma cupricumulans]
MIFMLLVLNEYLKEYPVKKIVQALYNNGISVKGDKLFLNNVEVSISSLANALNVNRRTLYETIKFINKNDVVRTIMENISVIPDISKISLLMGYEIVTIYINIGSFPKVLWEVMCLIKKYSSYIKEMYSMNSDLESNFIRIIFYSEIDKNIFREIDEIPGINRIVINSPVKLNIICNKCEIKICPHKISSELSKTDIL